MAHVANGWVCERREKREREEREERRIKKEGREREGE
jgi:hypothetical protein